MSCSTHKRVILCIVLVLFLHLPIANHVGAQILGVSNLCQTNVVRELDMNSILGIPSNATRRFSYPMQVYRDDGVALWTISPVIDHYAKYSVYRHALPSLEQDLSLAVDLLHAEVYLDIEPDETPIRRVCGTVDRRWSYGKVLSNELCIDFHNYRPYAPDKLLKLRFSQPWNSFFKIYEYYEDAVIEFGLNGSPLKYLSNLEFFHNYTGLVFRNLVNVALRVCYENVEDEGSTNLITNDIWPPRDYYYRRDVYHNIENLCDSIREDRGRYKVYYQDSVMNRTLGISDLRLYRFAADSGHQLIATIVGDFTAIDQPNKRSYQILQPALSHLEGVFKGSTFSVAKITEFNLTKSIINQQECKLTLVNFKINISITKALYADEKFNLTQRMNGIEIHTSSFTDMAFSYPDYYLAEVSCGVIDYGTDGDLKFSADPQLEISGIVRNCSSDNR